MTQMQNRFFFSIFADLASLATAKYLRTRKKNCPKIVYGKTGRDV